MKKIILLGLISLATLVQAQDTTKTKRSLDCYIGTGLSTSNGSNFDQSSYAGLEVGVCVKNLMFGFQSGRGNLDFSMPDVTENYWGELKAYITKEVGSVKVYGIAGWGQYYKTTHSFIEYGGGFVYSIKKIDLGVCVSSWDRVVYVTPGITYNFSIH